MRKATMSPKAVEAKLEWAEVDHRLAPDMRRALTDERMALVCALRSSDGARIAAARDEAVRVAAMWGADWALEDGEPGESEEVDPE